MWPFTAPPSRPARVPTDTVIPLNGHDDTAANRDIVIDFTLRFDDVLDAEKLKDALAKLASLGNWRKLGARVRINEHTGRLEYHVPATFSEERPPFTFSQVQYETSINENPVTSQLPRPTSHPSVWQDHREFNSYARDLSTPRKLEDYIYTDAPQISLHLVSFSDATLVTFIWPHFFTDAMGVAAIFDAWTLVLNGKENEVPNLIGFDYDPLGFYGSSPKDKYLLANKLLRGLNLTIFGVRYLLETFWEKWYTKEEHRTLCLPASTFASIKKAALKEVEAQKTFISDGDVLIAWFTRLILKEMPWTQGRTIEILNAFSLRGILSTTLLPRGSSYLSNAVAAVYAFLPAREILLKPISFTAMALRRAVVEQGTVEQMEAYLHILRGGPFVMGDLSSILFSYSNWSKANFHQTNFSSAVLKEGIPVEKRANLLGRPSYGFSIGHSENHPRNSIVIFGKDAMGNFWLSGTFRTGVWSRVEATLESLEFKQ